MSNVFAIILSAAILMSGNAINPEIGFDGDSFVEKVPVEIEVEYGMDYWILG